VQTEHPQSHVLPPALAAHAADREAAEVARKAAEQEARKEQQDKENEERKRKLQENLGGMRFTAEAMARR